MWSCDFEACDRPAIRSWRMADCTICDRHLCAKHLGLEYHHCPPVHQDQYLPKKQAKAEEITKLIAKINAPALLTRASQLRGGLPCHLVRDLQYVEGPAKDPNMGRHNYHVEIEFEDGVRWLARFRRINATTPPPDLLAHIMRSEVSTLKFLEKTKVPAPRVFDYCLDRSNPIGMEYILMEKLPGKPLQPSFNGACTEQVEKLIGQLADVYIELKKHPFDLIGALEGPLPRDVGRCAEEEMTDYVGSEMRPLGPFVSRGDYAAARVQLIIDLIMREEVYAEDAIDAFLAHRFVLDHVGKIFPNNRLNAGPTYLRHASDKILVDEDYNLTGLIDWQWARTDSISGAFYTPLALSYTVHDFFRGQTDLGADELILLREYEKREYPGKPDLEDVIRHGRIIQLFDEFCAFGYGRMKPQMGLFDGLRKALNIDADLDWESWKKKALVQHKDDSRLQELIKRHSVAVEGLPPF